METSEIFKIKLKITNFPAYIIHNVINSMSINLYNASKATQIVTICHYFCKKQLNENSRFEW